MLVKPVKEGMLLWRKEFITADGVRESRVEVRVHDIIWFMTSPPVNGEVTYYILRDPQQTLYKGTLLKDFEWHPNNRTCFNCKKSLSQTRENICKTCGGVRCDTDGFCLCDHPVYGKNYKRG